MSVLPSGAEIIQHVQAIEALLPALERELFKAQKAGAVSLARAFVVLHRLNERMLSDEKSFKPFRALYGNAKGKLIPETFEAAGVDSIPLSEGFRVGVSERTVASIKVGKKPEAYTWLRDNEKGDVIVPTVNASTLSALAKQLRENNIDLPEELFNVEFLPNASVTKT